MFALHAHRGILHKGPAHILHAFETVEPGLRLGEHSLFQDLWPYRNTGDFTNAPGNLFRLVITSLPVFLRMQGHGNDTIRKPPVPENLMAGYVAQVVADIRAVLVFKLVNNLLQLPPGYKPVKRRALLQAQPPGKFFREFIIRLFPLVGDGDAIGAMDAEQVAPGLEVFFTGQAYPGKK